MHDELPRLTPTHRATTFDVPIEPRFADSEAIACANALARSERGTHALRTISEWLATGGIGLDSSNQRAIIMLLLIAWRRPSAADNAIVKALTR